MIIASTWVLIFALWHLASIFAEFWHLHDFGELDFVITSLLLCLVCRGQQFQRAFGKLGPHFHASSLLGKQWLPYTFLVAMAISLTLYNTSFLPGPCLSHSSLSIYWLVFSIYLAPTTDLSMFLRGILVRISSPEAQSFISNSFQIISFAFRVRFLIRTSLSSILRIQSLPQHQSILAGSWAYSPGPDHAG